MVYVAPELHRAVRQVALDDGRSASDVYGEAARTWMAARGVWIGVGPDRARAATRSSPMADLAEAIDRQGKQIEELHAALAGMPGSAPRGGQGPAGTKVAEAMKVMLGILRMAGAAGMTTRELTAATGEAGLKSGAAETAKAVLLGAGIVRYEGKRCRLDAF